MYLKTIVLERKYNKNNQINNSTPARENEAHLNVIETTQHDAHTLEFKFLNDGDVSAFVNKVVLHLQFDGYGPSRTLGHERAYQYEIIILHPKEEAIPALNRLEKVKKESTTDAYYRLKDEIKGKSIVLARFEGKEHTISTLTIPVSQNVPSRGVDRIIMTFHSSANPPPTYKARAEFFYNGNETVISGEFNIWL